MTNSSKYYTISEDEKGHDYIECKICKMRSYHEDDIRFRYCANCHEFLDLKEIEEILRDAK